MRLKILVPTQVLVDRPVTAIVAESVKGSFCLLPRHIDLLTALVPGILTFQTADGDEGFLAVDGGILIKCGLEVLISTRNAFWGSCLEDLRHEVEQQFYTIDEQERQARTAIARMETSLARQFTALAAEGR